MRNLFTILNMEPVGKEDFAIIWKQKAAMRFLQDSWLFEEPWLKL